MNEVTALLEKGTYLGSRRVEKYAINGHQFLLEARKDGKGYQLYMQTSEDNLVRSDVDMLTRILNEEI